MRVLVTGAGGFIGSHLVVRLAAEGHEVIAAVHRQVAPPEVVRAAARTVFMDVREPQGVGLLQPEVVYHLAGCDVAGQWLGDTTSIFDGNLLGTVSMFDMSMRVGVRRFVHFSSSEAYGAADLPFFEDKPQIPITPYGLAKCTAEEYCWMRACSSQKIEVARIRGFNTYGPGLTSRRWISRVIESCLRNDPVYTTRGEQTRDYVYIDDLVDGLVRAGTVAAAASAGPINLCTGQEVAIAHLDRLIHGLTRSTSEFVASLPYRPVEIWRMFGDNSRAKAVLGWTPKVKLTDGLVSTIEYCKSKEGVR